MLQEAGVVERELARGKYRRRRERRPMTGMLVHLGRFDPSMDRRAADAGPGSGIG